MNQENQDIYGKILSVEIRNFFNEKFANSLKQNEKKRKKYIVFLVLISIFNILLLLEILHLFLQTNINVLKLMYFILPLLFGIYLHLYIVKSYKKKIKSLVMEKLLSFIGDFKMYKMKFKDTEYIHSLKLFNGFNFPDINNYILGKYGLLDIEIIEMQNKKSLYNQSHIFQGVLIKIPSIKKFKNSTVIKIKDSKENQNIGEKVNINDSEFERYYDVYSDDKVEARCLITTSFMSRMVQLVKHELVNNISVSFEYGNVNIAVSSDKDWFEVPIMKPATDITNYRAIVLEIISILKIIDSLKLEKNIGL